VIQVGGADAGDPFPREHEHRPVVAGVDQRQAVGHRQPRRIDEQMAAAQRADALPGAAQAVGPGAGGVDHRAGVQGQAVAAFQIGDVHPGAAVIGAAVLGADSGGAGVIERTAAMPRRFQQAAHHQPAIVGEGVGVAHGAVQARRIQPRDAHQHLGAGHETVVANAGQKVVQRQHRGHRPAPREPAVTQWEQVLGPAPPGRADRAAAAPAHAGRHGSGALRPGRYSAARRGPSLTSGWRCPRRNPCCSSSSALRPWRAASSNTPAPVMPPADHDQVPLFPGQFGQ
jgi:hypothetical protein